MGAGISSIADQGKEETMADPKAMKLTGDSSRVNQGNTIKVAMEDLSETDQKDLELKLQHELEEVTEERRKKKLTCF
jgi:Flp pilus assembly secretin CpaC